jgi:trans-2,3-dihydro-3-hydroxyanthranilate isomerase
MRTFRFVTVDVFTRERFGGNQLAVFPDARGLEATHMQRITAEFNYSEATFVFPPDDPANTARVRIFESTGEIPFAGHPNVGTAFLLGQIGTAFGRPVGESMRFEELGGVVVVHLLREGQTVYGARIRAPQALQIRTPIDAQVVAACVSLPVEEIVATGQQPVIASVGLPFALAEVQSVGGLGRARPDVAAFRAADARYPQPEVPFSVFLYARQPLVPTTLRTRMFAPLSNIPEDPATGSASAALGAFLASVGPQADTEVSLTLEQGVEMGRPSTINVLVSKAAGAVRYTDISGQCVTVMRGEIDL